MRDQFLVRQLDLTSLEALNRQFTNWVEHDYNATEHDALGMKPIDRFGIDLNRIRYLSPSEHSDELFYAEATRQVKKDNTFSFQGRRYETPVDLRDKEVQLRYERCNDLSPTVILYYKNECPFPRFGRILIANLAELPSEDGRRSTCGIR